MTRALLLSLGWLVAAMGLYVAVVVLEFYWNFFDWQPELDLRAWFFFVGMVCALVATRFLAWAARDRLSQGVSLVLCLALLVLAVYESTRLNSSHTVISYAVFCLKKKN